MLKTFLAATSSVNSSPKTRSTRNFRNRTPTLPWTSCSIPARPGKQTQKRQRQNRHRPARAHRRRRAQWLPQVSERAAQRQPGTVHSVQSCSMTLGSDSPRSSFNPIRPFVPRALQRSTSQDKAKKEEPKEFIL
ncbi:hypothetical protein L596_022493 [Steinernema carpocapsae]|uniref:Uncharacterized protein n=1 Tax=Steinernema carpocapsae TaxID=34508 RepID=A0A4V6XVX5_STECR|nr:hypothetical protein L596_022493 [Steinernema carpocapsae]